MQMTTVERDKTYMEKIIRYILFVKSFKASLSADRHAKGRSVCFYKFAFSFSQTSSFLASKVSFAMGAPLSRSAAIVIS